MEETLKETDGDAVWHVVCQRRCFVVQIEAKACGSLHVGGGACAEACRAVQWKEDVLRRGNSLSSGSKMPSTSVSLQRLMVKSFVSGNAAEHVGS